MLRIKVPTKYPPLRNSLFFLIPVSLKCHTSPPPYPLGGGSHPPPHPSRVRGWRRMTFQTTYPSEIFQRPKVLTQSPPSEMTFKAPLRKSRPWGKQGGGGGVVDTKWHSPDLKDTLNCAAIL